MAFRYREVMFQNLAPRDIQRILTYAPLVSEADDEPDPEPPCGDCGGSEPTNLTPRPEPEPEPCAGCGDSWPTEPKCGPIFTDHDPKDVMARPEPCNLVSDFEFRERDIWSVAPGPEFAQLKLRIQVALAQIEARELAVQQNIGLANAGLEFVPDVDESSP